MPVDFTLSNWETLKPFFEELNSRVLDSAEALEVWLKDVSEVQAVISEDACWRQIRMTCDHENKDLDEAFTYFCMEI